MKRIKMNFKECVLAKMTTVLILFFCWSALQAQEVKWIKVGSLHNWYMAVGCEPETARRGLVSDQQDGLRWPAAYPHR